MVGIAHQIYQQRNQRWNHVYRNRFNPLKEYDDVDLHSHFRFPSQMLPWAGDAETQGAGDRRLIARQGGTGPAVWTPSPPNPSPSLPPLPTSLTRTETEFTASATASHSWFLYLFDTLLLSFDWRIVLLQLYDSIKLIFPRAKMFLYEHVSPWTTPSWKSHGFVGRHSWNHH